MSRFAHGLTIPQRLITPTTWNPSDKAGSSTLSNGNLTNTTTSGGFGAVRSIFGAAGGKWYWEYTVTTVGAGQLLGLGNGSASVAGSLNVAGFWYYRSADGNFAVGGGSNTAYGASYTTGDVIGVSLDLTTGDVHFWKNGADQGLAVTLSPGTYYAACSDGSSSGAAAVITANFGASAFTGTPPAGFIRGFGAVA